MKAPDLRDPCDPEDGPDRVELGGEPACLLPLLEGQAGRQDSNAQHGTAGQHEPAETDERPAASNPTEEDTPMTDRIDDTALATILRGLGDGVVVADRHGTIILWNEGAERIFGWTAAEAVGQTLDLIVPERHRRAHNEGYATVMATGVTRYAEDLLQVPALHRDGGRRSIAFSVSMLTGDDGAVRAITAVVRDETARWEADRALRARLRELEGAG